MKKLLLLVLSFALLAISNQTMYAQGGQRTVKGVVVDAGGTPIIGAALFKGLS